MEMPSSFLKNSTVKCSKCKHQDACAMTENIRRCPKKHGDEKKFIWNFAFC